MLIGRVLYIMVFVTLASISGDAVCVLKDPTAPLNKKNLASNSEETDKVSVKSRRKINLQSIFVGKKHKMAVINGYLFFEGERRYGLLVKSISKDHVFVKHKGRSIKLTVSKGIRLYDKLGN